MTSPEPLRTTPARSYEALDPQVLDDLREALDDVDGQFVAGLISVYETQAVELMTELIDAADQMSLQRLGFAAHSLKGSSANVGGSRLAVMCAELEHWEGPIDDLPGRVAAARTELGALLRELGEFRPR